MIRSLAATVMAAALVAPAAAQNTKPATQPAAPGFALTVYSTADPAQFDPQQYAALRRQNPYYATQNPLPGYGVVRETRPITLEKGENTLRFADVAAGIDPTTVAFQSLTDAATAVLEQNYEYDLVSPEKLLEKYVGKKVTLRRSGEGGKEEVIEGELLANDGGNLVLKAGGQVRVISRQGISEVALADAGGLITQPTLVWKLSTDAGGKQMARVTYQTDGLTWRADYNFVIAPDDAAVDVSAWVTLLNESGKSYPNAALKLVAGDVQRIQPPQQGYASRARLLPVADAAKEATGFQEKSFFEYHLYTLGRRTSLGDNSTKQIELFPPVANVPAEKIFVYYGLPERYRTLAYNNSPNTDRDLGTEMNKQVDTYLQLTNAEKNGMGMPLPAGRIRVYKRDPADGSQEFIGEDVIGHTPREEKVRIKLGSAFDLVGERRQTDFTVNAGGHVITESFEIKLRNRKKEPVTILVKENLFRWLNWEITASSDKWEKQDSRTIHFPIVVKPDEERVVTYTVKYTW